MANINKTDLIAKVAEKASIDKKTAKAAIEAVLATVVESVKGGDKVSILGFGTFSKQIRAARTGKNPQTGAEVAIPEKISLKFKVGKGVDVA